MVSGRLQGVRVAILVTDGFEVLQLLEPRRALDNANATTYVVAPSNDNVTGLTEDQSQVQIPVDIPLKSARAEDFHALLLPGGKQNASQLAADSGAVNFIKGFTSAGKPVAATGEVIEVLTEAGLLSGRTAPASRGSSEKPRESYSSDDRVMFIQKMDDLNSFSNELADRLAALRERSAEMRRTV